MKNDGKSSGCHSCFAKKTAALLICTAVLLSLSGCWDMNEINERVFVLGLGIDFCDRDEPDGGAKYDFTFLYTMMNEESVYKTARAAGNSLPDAISAFNRNNGTDANFEHLLCTVVGSEVARSDFIRVINCLFSWAAVRRQSVVAASDGRAADLLSASVLGNDTASVIVAVTEATDTSRGRSATASLHNLFISDVNKSGFFIYELTLIDSVTGRASNPDSVSESDAEEESAGLMSVSGAHSYGHDWYRGYLNREDAGRLRYFFGSQTDGMIGIDIAQTRMYFRIKNSSCTKAVECKGDQLYSRILIRLDCSLFDSGGQDMDRLSETENFYAEAERMISEQLQGDLDGIIQRCRDGLGAAPIGLDTAFRQRYGERYDGDPGGFDAMFREGFIDVEVSCKVRRVGVVK